MPTSRNCCNGHVHVDEPDRPACPAPLSPRNLPRALARRPCPVRGHPPAHPARRAQILERRAAGGLYIRFGVARGGREDVSGATPQAPDLFDQASEAWRQGRPEVAAALLEALIRAEPHHVTALNTLAMIALNG